MSREYKLLKQIAILIVGLLNATIGTNRVEFADVDLISVGGRPPCMAFQRGAV